MYCNLKQKMFFFLGLIAKKMVKHPRQYDRSFGSDSLTDPCSKQVTLNFFHKEKKNQQKQQQKNNKKNIEMKR